MHTIPVDIILSVLAILAVLQGLSILLTNLEIAAKRIEGRSTWIARDGTVYEEFAVTELKGSQVMQLDFEESRPEPALAGVASLPVSI